MAIATCQTYKGISLMNGSALGSDVATSAQAEGSDRDEMRVLYR